ncbi:MAG TPA: prolyl oligopeptidase family serine peptidase [Vicinamibacteria bacterium]|nr:prolyl oligopeptidase family serine peptidase [Vicinamibacteria bacterium]
MKMTLLLLALLLPALLAAQAGPRLAYPKTRQVDQVDDYFGTKVEDPYRWLEDDNSAETRAWVEAENKVTFAYLEAIPERKAIEKRLTALWDYERFGLPSKEGPWYVFGHNSGLQNQAVLLRAKGLDATPEVLLDPNTLSKDGTVALGSAHYSDDGSLMAYSTAEAGSDWIEWHVREVATGRDREDHVRWSKFSGASWKKDGSGFYYSRYDAPREGDALKGVNKYQKVHFHRLGTPQEGDPLVYQRKDQPDWGFVADVTEDGRFLLLYQSEGTDPRNRIFVQDLQDPKGAIAPFLDAFDAEYGAVGNDGDLFYVRTDRDAPRRRLVAIDRRDPAKKAWKEILPQGEGRAVLSSIDMIGERFVVVWQVDAHDLLKIYDKSGRLEREVTLPGIGTVTVSGRRRDQEFFYAFTSYTYPTTIYRCDPATGQSAVFRQPKVPFDPAAYETVQVFYPSKDGTRIPMFVTARRGAARDGRNPTLLTGYGGFNIANLPAFSPGVMAWLEMGGVYAVANLRGGSEYGKEWYDAGRLKNKQNVFDDFIAAAEHLIRERWTSTPKLAIAGGSNGGLLVGAVLNQRPDLFGAALPAVGVMDMLRFHLFTIGWAWKSDYASSETKEGFDTLIKYSPLHNIRPGTRYPPVLVTTGDHDDRVVPAHSFKYAATLQAAQAGDAPVLIRIETRAGHGAGKPTAKIIEEAADRYAFLVRNLGMTLPPAR